MEKKEYTYICVYEHISGKKMSACFYRYISRGL